MLPFSGSLNKNKKISPGVSSTILNDHNRIKILQNPTLGFSEILEEAFLEYFNNQLV